MRESAVAQQHHGLVGLLRVDVLGAEQRDAPWYATRNSRSRAGARRHGDGSRSRHQFITQSDFEKKRWPPMSMRLPL
jgi:hypothetical protein